MHTSSHRYICPGCQAEYDSPSKFCGRCGADMRNVVGVHAATASAGTEHNSGPVPGENQSSASRRRGSDLPVHHGRDQWLGRLIDDRYRVLEIVGHGGMGVVYRVEHQRMGKIAAMKVLHAEYSRDPEVVARFRREAEAISQLTHPNTVQVFDFGTTEGVLHLIMEYVRGPDLSALLKRDGPIPFVRAAPLLAQIGAALSEAHELGIIHRDLKPENVLVTRTQRGRDFVKILDFGLAKLNKRDERNDLSERGAIIGTPYYMSPEQIRGDAVDGRTDIYALGSMMYRMLTGEYAFVSRTPVGVLTKHLTEDLVPPSERAPECRIAPILDAIVIRAMAKAREDRYPTVGAMIDAIEAAFALICADQGAVSVSGLEMPEVSSTEVSSTEVSSTQSWDTGPRAGVAQPLTRDDSDDVDYGIDSAIRLRRADLDEYERSLRRRHLLRVIGVPLFFCALIGVGIYWLGFRPEMPRRTELEPNNQLDAATLIAPGQPVTGYLGRRIDKQTSDRDYYRIARLPEPGTWPQGLTATAHVTSLPNIDIELSLLDPTGKVLAQTLEGGVGHDEWLHRIRVDSPVFLMVTESMLDGPRLPIENVSDAYTLTLRFDPVVEGLESEPNDGPSDALPLRADTPVSGYLDRRQDVDTYRFEGEEGLYELVIDGAELVPVAWQLDAGSLRNERQVAIELVPGGLLRLARTDGALPREFGLPGVDQAYTITLTRP